VTELDDEMVPLALELVTEFGMSVQFEVLTTQDYSAAQGHTVEVPTWVTATITPPDDVHVMMIDGDLIQEGDQIAYIAASGLAFTPVLNQLVDMNSASGDEDLQDLWTVVQVGQIRPGQQTALWKLVMRH
jgi:hypothetical protein